MATAQPSNGPAASSETPANTTQTEAKASGMTADAKPEAKTDATPVAAADTKTDTPAPKTAPAAPTSDAPKKLTAAELKAQKQAEKAKRRAAVVAAKGGAAGAAGAVGGGGGGSGGQPVGAAVAAAGGGKAKGKQGADAAGVAVGGTGAGAGVGGGPIVGGLARRSSVAAATAAAAAAAAAVAAAEREKEREKDARSGIPECFSHLSMAKRISVAQAHKDVHPAVLVVGQQMATFTLRDSMARLEATMGAFQKVIRAYRTPPGNAFSRHFVSHVLNPQIEYLTECRPMCFAMGNGIRLLKAWVSQLDLDLDDADAIELLCELLDCFIQERIHVAAVVITREAAAMIDHGDTVLAYGGPRLVRAVLEQAWTNGVRFDLTVIDDPDDADGPGAGQALATEFRRRRDAEPVDAPGHTETRVTYSPSLDGLDSHVARATKVLLGVESVFANGALLAPAGTSDVARSAAALGCPVIALAETVNFDRDRVATDALAHNEIDPEHCDADSFRLLFDTTPSSLVSMLITEYEEASGMVPAQAIYSVLRSKEDTN